MKISRFFGITTREAMRQVRLALGPDALIVSNRRVADGVEILATDSSSIEPVEGASPSLAASAPGAQGAAAQQHAQQQVPGPQAPATFQRPVVPPLPLKDDDEPGIWASRPPVSPRAPVAPRSSVPGAPAGAPAPSQGGPSAVRRPSPMSPMGAYAAAVQAAYGLGSSEAAPAAHQAPPAAPVANVPPAVPTPAAAAAAAAAPAASEPSTSASVPYRYVPATSVEPNAAPSAQALPGMASTGGVEPDVMDAIGAMRGALETRIDELLWGNQLRSSPHAANLFQTLLGHGFSTALLRSMLKRLPEDLTGRAALQWARQELVAHVPVIASEDALWQPGLALALVGPTGVGKTTTIAKLAARCVRRFGPDKLVLVTTDTYRIGAHEQLKIYGQMLKVPVHVVRSAAELQGVISGLLPDQIVLIDNVGISQRDRYITEQAAMLAAADRDVTRLLVLNAASHGETLDEVARSYASDGGSPLKGCIITKVDEASRLGAVLDTVLRYRLPIHYVSIGQKVPEHLAFLRADELVDQALTQLPATRSLYAPTEADFAALMSMSQAATASVSAATPDLRKQQMQTLPRLLSMTGADAASLTPEDLINGCECIDELTASSEAYALWKAFGAGGMSSAEASLRRLNRVIQNAWAESGQKRFLAVHDQIALRSGPSTGHLRASLILNAQGVPVASPAQQLFMPDGWYASDGDSAAQGPELRSCLIRQFDGVSESLPDIPLLHVFEGGSAALWRELTARNESWLAHIPAITRLHVEDGPTTAQALAKTLDYRPVADPDYLFALSTLQGAPSEDRALWVSSVSVEIVSRGQETLPATLVAARLVDRHTGKLVKSILGLHAGLEISAEKLATWLVVKVESREAMRHAAAGWGMLSAPEGTASLLSRGLVAVQVGLAAWQLGNGPQATDSRHIAAAMLGKKRLASSAVPAATFKLFALKELMSAQ